MEKLLQRKADLRQRISALNAELTPALAKVENLRSRIVDLEDDFRTVLDELRETKGNEK